MVWPKFHQATSPLLLFLDPYSPTNFPSLPPIELNNQVFPSLNWIIFFILCTFSTFSSLAELVGIRTNQSKHYDHVNIIDIKLTRQQQQGVTANHTHARCTKYQWACCAGCRKGKACNLSWVWPRVDCGGLEARHKHFQFYKEYTLALAPYLARIYHKSLNRRKIPSECKKALLTTMYKKGKRTDPHNYTPISLTSICCRILEYILSSNIVNFLEM